MKKLCVALGVLVTSLFAAQAQVELFSGEAAKLLGAPSKEGEESGTHVQLFAHKGLTLKVFYAATGKASKVEAWKTVEADGIVKYTALDDKEIEGVLKLNAGEAKWVEAPPGEAAADLKKWSRGDGKLKAEYSAARKMLVVSSGAIPATAGMAPTSSAKDNLEVGGKPWVPFQFGLTPTRNWPPKQQCYGMKLSVISGGTTVGGLDCALVACLTDRCGGVQGSFANLTDNFQGLQGAMVNVSKQFDGVQAGIVNVVKEADADQLTPEGAQFGLVNYSKKMYGFQFGLVNIIDDGMLYFMPIFNVNTVPKKP